MAMTFAQLLARQSIFLLEMHSCKFLRDLCWEFNMNLINCSTAVKDRIVAFLLFLGKLAITGTVGK